jgi:hypothetical protein
MRRSKDLILAARRWLHAKHRYPHIGLAAARVFRGRLYMLLHPDLDVQTVALLHAYLRNFDALAACFIVREK